MYIIFLFDYFRKVFIADFGEVSQGTFVEIRKRVILIFGKDPTLQ